MLHARGDYNDTVICVQSKKAIEKALDEIISIAKGLYNYNNDGPRISADDKGNSTADAILERVSQITTSLYGGKIPDQEPVFIIRGQDKLAPHIVGQWASALESTKQDGASIMAMMAIRHAEKMSQWKPRKLPDLPK